MKKDKNIEITIYKLLGIKLFRKMACFLLDSIFTLFSFDIPKEKRKEYLHNTTNMYYLGKVNNLEDIEKFKKNLYFFTVLHLIGVLILIPNFINIIIGNTTLSFITSTFVAFGINSYCIMLQRYNCIRINKFIEKMKLHNKKQKEIAEKKLQQENLILNQSTYKTIDKKEKKVSINNYDLIENATIDQLSKYHEYLTHLKKIGQTIQQNESYSEEKQQIEMSSQLKYMKH